VAEQSIRADSNGICVVKYLIRSGVLTVPPDTLLIYLEIDLKMGEHARHGARHTSSNGLVSLKQLSQTSFTARSADSLSRQLGLAMTDNTARLRTHASGDR